MTDHMHPDEIRTLFSTAMSAMYRKEVPLYGDLLDLVGEVNAETLAADPALRAQLAATGDLDRLDVERHGAIRLGTAGELVAIRRMFAVMGMVPVDYYDLSVAGIPVHSTAFRPVDEASLRRNPFRVFTSLLRLDLIGDRALAARAEEILERRRIVTDRASALIALAEAQGGLTGEQARAFVDEALETFRWHSDATIDAQTYARLVAAHRLIADVVSFRGPHINHLTPRTLDIDAVQRKMPGRGIVPKAVIEGPPRRDADILLRQTSFKALEETVRFEGETGSHTARFGEIEQRGVALTPAGRALYDTALAASGAGDAGTDDPFAALPDDLETLRRQGLAFFRYRAGEAAFEGAAQSVTQLIDAGALIADPQVYEDFLPVSAAGIFRSNLDAGSRTDYGAAANRGAFEEALGARVIEGTTLYERTEADSRTAALAQIGQGHLASDCRGAK